MPILMQRSRTLLEEWLVAAADGHKPDGEAVQVWRVQRDEVVEVRYAGEGAGGRYLRAMFAGEEPVLVGRPTEALRARGMPEETCVHFARFLITPPCVVYETSGIIRLGGSHEPLVDRVFLCATDEQIADARACLSALLMERAAVRAAVGAKTRPLRRFERGPSEVRP